eukprot:CAMPEP_0118687516 /NCGR_PEP_ID=MMETSP0800-20121206/8424_1 /TAXON_ID=210618 ORGANISM="Striatella unipunctata, Strain CCMP2910" /NCGR_SAMPLE_ID=MMETSP0800 /ASSEMBLY_ACC=CAM_ASM_000638 /LENGTH=257 /DNA_ID=CAMNT_0006584705 /DNA_START=7 /DNA_END=780 /DNA_ORIENTATION=-
MAPRYYSISSSPLVNPTSLTVAFSVVDYLTPQQKRRIGGVATHWLESLSAPFLGGTNNTTTEFSKIQIFPKPSDSFHLPASHATPLIMIGPGTGIAPFMGFISHRIQQQQSNDDKMGKMHLYFGCRYLNHDWLYHDEMLDFQNELRANSLLDVHVTSSRDDPDKKQYVQDLMRQNAQELSDLVFRKNACVYVCGDGNHMGKDVQNTLVDLFEAHLQENDDDDDDYTGESKRNHRQEAKDYLAKLKQDGRFLMDIWSG